MAVNLETCGQQFTQWGEGGFQGSHSIAMVPKVTVVYSGAEKPEA